MVERLKELWSKIQAWWNKFTTKQKSIIIGIVAVVVFTLAIIIYVLSRPQFVRLTRCDNSADASKLVGILDSAGITHKESSDGLTIEVKSEQLSSANLAMGSAGYVPDDYSIKDYLGSSMTTTSSMQWLQYQEFMSKKLANDIVNALSAVKTATVNLDMPQDKGTLISEKEQATAWVQLEIDGTFTSTNAANLAKSIATCLNTSTSNVTIMDQDAELLFAGNDDYSFSSSANSMQELQGQAEAMTAKKVKVVLLGTKQFDDVAVSSNLNVDYSEYEKTIKEYYANADRSEGMIAQQDLYESESNGQSGGVPGTDSNDETTYYYDDYDNSSSSSTENSTKYLPNESVVYQNKVAGCIDYATSSITVALVTYKNIYEENVKAQGLLDGLSWEEYKLANDQDVKLSVDDDYYSMVANAAGIDRENITIVAYESPVFYDKEKGNINWTTIASIVTLLIIIGLLAFVMLKSFKPEKVEEEEAEALSVEQLLQSTVDAQVGDIDVETKSETRKMVEKFVDENPEAAAMLLRNWLNADWG
ncbi:MAG: flagellar M-ring protein FliF [Lachnospiraceae bacterium]|nr:flagellar M-ring protein FliF [Lachnospiraceae bacterium]